MSKTEKKPAKKIEKKAVKKTEKVSVDKKPTPKVVKIQRRKFKCATTGKHFCAKCKKEIKRGNTLRMIDVKYADGTKKSYAYCCKKHRNEHCAKHNIPLL